MTRSAKITFPVLILTVLFIGGFYVYSLFSSSIPSVFAATTATTRPNANVTTTFANCTGGSCGTGHYAVVDETAYDPGDYVSTGLSGSGGEEEEFAMTSVSGSTSIVTQVVVFFQAQAAGGCNSACDEIDVRIRIDGAYQVLQTITLTGTDTLYSRTFSGSWTGDDDLQIEFVRIRQGSGSPGGRDDDARISQVYADVTFSQPPTVITNGASGVSDSGATLNGEANPNNDATTGWFRYSTTSPGTCNTTFGTSTPAPENLGSGSTNVLYSKPTGSVLSPNTTYYYCAVANNVAGTTTSPGAPQSFTTSAIPPGVTSDTPASVTNISATLRSNVDPNNSSTNSWFRYHTVNPGTCTDDGAAWSGSSTTTSTPVGSGDGFVAYSDGVSLTANTTYYYCAVASNAAGKTVGSALRSFSTLAGPDLVVPPLSLNVSGTLIGGFPLAFNGDVLNTGDYLAEATTARFRLDMNNNGIFDDPGDLTLGTPPTISLTPTDPPYDVSSSPVWDAIPGTYSYELCANYDYSGEPFESNEGNNCSISTSFTVVSQTLNITPFTPSFASGENPLDVTLQADITYSGPPAETINYSFWWHCTDPTTSVADASQPPPSGCGALAAPAPGLCLANANGYKCEAVSAESQSTSVHTYNSGSYVPKVIVERGDAPWVQDQKSVVVDGEADLVAQNLSIDLPSPIDGQSLTFSGDIYNQGASTAAATTARFRLDVGNNGSFIDPEDLILGTPPTSSLAPLATESESSSPSWVSVAGTHRYELCADYLDAEPLESDDGNNCTTATFSVASAQETAGNTSGWAWSSTVGWMSFNCATDAVPGSCAASNYYGVTVDTTTGELSGYAWSENIGWISFNQLETSTPPEEPYIGETFIAHLDTVTNQFSGWGRVLSVCEVPPNTLPCATADNEGGWDGWIKLHE